MLLFLFHSFFLQDFENLHVVDDHPYLLPQTSSRSLSV